MKGGRAANGPAAAWADPDMGMRCPWCSGPMPTVNETRLRRGGPYVWQRAFWTTAGEGFRDGWVIGAVVGQGFTMAVGIVALHSVGWVAVLAFALWEVARLYAAGVPSKVVGEMFGVTQQHVWSVGRRSWLHLTAADIAAGISRGPSYAD